MIEDPEHASAPPDPFLRPARIGDLIDRALQLYRRHFRTFFVLMLIVELPIYLLQKIYETALRGAIPGGVLRPDAMTPEIMQQVLATLGLIVPLTFLGMILLLSIARGALLLAGEEAWRGRPPRPGPTLRRLRPRLLPLLRTTALLLFFFALGVLAGVLPGAAIAVAAGLAGSVVGAIVGLLLGLALAFLILLTLYLRWYLVEAAVVLEGLSGLAALRRSRDLMNGRVAEGLLGRVKMRAAILLAILFLLMAIPGLLIGLPQLLLASAYTAPGLPPDILSIPFGLRLPFELAAVLLGTLLTPVGILAMLFFYFDLRIRREGLDLELRAQASRAPLAAVPLAAVPIEASPASGPSSEGPAG